MRHLQSVKLNVKRMTDAKRQIEFYNYFVTISVMVLEVDFPFFGVTVTATLHDPAFNPLSAPLDTLQFFAEPGITLRVTLDGD